LSSDYLSRDERAAIISTMLDSGRASSGSQWVKVDCGFCPLRVGKEDHEKSFAFNRVSTGYVCFRCGVKGYVEGGGERFAHIPTGPSDDQLARLRRPVLGYQPIWPGTEGYTATWSYDARQHLQKRKIPEHLWRTAELGVSTVKWDKKPDGDPTLNLAFGRVIVPFLVPGGWMGWSGRAVWKGFEKRDKYRLQKHPEFVLYNHDALLVKSEEPVYVVEGCFDALALWPDAVAVCGDVTENQIYALAAARRPVVMVPDGDAWEKGMSRMLRLRLEGARAGCVRLPPKKDPDEVPYADLWEAGRESLGCEREVSL